MRGKSETSVLRFMSEPIVLSDEQVDQLNTYPAVMESRSAFLAAMAECQHDTPGTLSKKVLDLEKAYQKEFYERLGWVRANPPAPKPPKVFLAGFARHA